VKVLLENPTPRRPRGIAERFHLSQPTVSTHSGNLFRKLELPNDPVDNRRVNAVLRYLHQTNTGP
jgi:DNA-binding NarL/FixJ family response regulator